MNQEKIEFYKNRTIGERFSAAGDFIRQNWKVLLKNIVYIGVPIALIFGYFLQNYMQGIFSMINLAGVTGSYDTLSGILIPVLGIMLSSILLYLFLFSITGAILNKYVKGSLTEDAGWADLKNTVFSFAGKLFVQGFILFLIIVAIGIVFAIIISIGAALDSSIFTGIVTFLLIILLYGAIFAFYPFFALLPYPIFFENASAWQAIKKSFKLGFRYWGSTFLTMFLGGLLTGIVSYILMMPYIIYTILNIGTTGFLGYVLAMLTSLVFVVVYPVFVVFVGLQYTSIVEREEGVSLQDKVAEFDNL
ncbi:hypothetical protein FACS189437_06330 [Bacteroidia bacterium]|nr:hypothetical protein FACS189437_06330 [Bacteroidia bacterium]